VRRWQPERRIVADGGYASMKLLDRCRRLSNPITFITSPAYVWMPPSTNRLRRAKPGRWGDLV